MFWKCIQQTFTTLSIFNFSYKIWCYILLKFKLIIHLKHVVGDSKNGIKNIWLACIFPEMLYMEYFLKYCSNVFQVLKILKLINCALPLADTAHTRLAPRRCQMQPALARFWQSGQQQSALGSPQSRLSSPNTFVVYYLLYI